jgi:hypothetical protein
MLNAVVNFDKSVLQETIQTVPSQLGFEVPRTALLRATCGRNEGGQILVLSLFVCFWYQSKALLRSKGRRSPGTKQLNHYEATLSHSSKKAT